MHNVATRLDKLSTPCPFLCRQKIGDGITPRDFMNHWQCWCRTWSKLRSNLVYSNLAEILKDATSNPHFRCMDLLSIGDLWHDISIHCPHNYSCHALSSEIIQAKDDHDVCFFMRTGLQRRSIPHWRRGLGQNRFGMSGKELLHCYCPFRKCACPHSK